MRMNCDRPTYQIRPYEVLYRHRDIFGKWGNWRLHSRHFSMDEQSAELDRLHNSDHAEYRAHLNESEYAAKLNAEIRRAKKDEIAGYAPADGREL